AKRWPTEHWIELAAALAARGLAAAVVTRGDGSNCLEGTGMAEIVAATPGEAVDVLSACRAVVGVDTGHTHIAAQQGPPTVTLSRMPAIYFRRWRHTRLVAGSVCDPACQRVEKTYAYHQVTNLSAHNPAPRLCPVGGRCLTTIEPASVMATLEEIC